MARTTDTLRLGDGAQSLISGAPGLVTVFSPDGSIAPVVLLVRDQIVLGREPPPGGITLPFGSVSRSHAKLTRDADGFRVEDLGGRNGTYVNGTKITSTRLDDGDELRVGAVMLKLVARGAERYLPSSDTAVPASVAPLVGGPSIAAVRNEILLVAPGGRICDLSVAQEPDRHAEDVGAFGATSPPRARQPHHGITAQSLGDAGEIGRRLRIQLDLRRIDDAVGMEHARVAHERDETGDRREQPSAGAACDLARCERRHAPIGCRSRANATTPPAMLELALVRGARASRRAHGSRDTCRTIAPTD